LPGLEAKNCRASEGWQPVFILNMIFYSVKKELYEEIIKACCQPSLA
jgi:hypothetical protein